MTAITERRKYKRISFTIPIRVLIGNQELETSMANISAGGLAVVSEKEINIGTEVLLSFSLMQDVNFDKIKGKVVRKESISSEFLIGLVMEDIVEENRKKIDSFVNLMQLVKSTVLFSALNEEEIKQIVTIGKVESFPVDKVIFSEGMEANAIYIIVTGAVRIKKTVSLGMQGTRDETIALMREGEIFGEMAILDDYPRAASAISHRDTLALVIEKKNFRELLVGETELAKKLLWIFVKVLCKRLRQTNAKIADAFLFTESALSDMR